MSYFELSSNPLGKYALTAILVLEIDKISWPKNDDVVPIS
jgi:hypothetical protein